MRSRHSLVKLLAPYGCKLVRQIEPGFELWETGWGAPFKLFPEGGGYYGDQQLPRIRAVISSTMPTDWKIDHGRQTPAALRPSPRSE